MSHDDSPGDERGGRGGGVSLVIQLAKQGDSSFDPVLRTLVGGQSHFHDEIGGMSGRGKHSPSFGRLVHRRLVDRLLFQVVFLNRHQLNLEDK